MNAVPCGSGSTALGQKIHFFRLQWIQYPYLVDTVPLLFDVNVKLCKLCHGKQPGKSKYYFGAITNNISLDT